MDKGPIESDAIGKLYYVRFFRHRPHLSPASSVKKIGHATRF